MSWDLSEERWGKVVEGRSSGGVLRVASWSAAIANCIGCPETQSSALLRLALETKPKFLGERDLH